MKRLRTEPNRRCGQKANIRFLILKRIFGFNKVRYRGLDKNANRLFCGLRIGQFVHGQKSAVATNIGGRTSEIRN